MAFFIFFFEAFMQLHFKSSSYHPFPVMRCLNRYHKGDKEARSYIEFSYQCSHGPPLLYLANAMATPPSTFNILPVDFFRRPPTNAKQAFAMSSGKMISFNSVRFA